MSIPQETLEQRIQRNHLKLQELSINLERLDLEFNNILAELSLAPEQLDAFVHKKENFTLPSWDKIQTEKKQLDEKLDLRLKNIKDPLKIKKTFLERGSIQSHWLFIR
jgi:hypothetical protein